MKSLRGGARLLHAFVHAVSGWWTIRFAFPDLDALEREERVQRWAGRMLQILGVQLRVHGAPPDGGPMLLVANHISWLDILVIHASRHCRFVSKAQVRHWPLIGTLSAGAGTLFIERDSRRDAMRVVHHMAESLRAGDVLAIFPEGTTSDGRTLLPFHGNLFHAAISAGAPVQPVSITFVDVQSGQPSFAPIYVGDETLVQSLWRTVSAPPISALVVFGEPQQSAGRDRRSWAAQLREAVAALRTR